MRGDFDRFYKGLTKVFGGGLALSAAMAAGVSVAAVGLLGLSGWFLTGAAMAGAAGPIVAQGFNYLLPAAAIRFLAIARTGLRYGERLIGHGVALRAMAQLRPALFQQMLRVAPEVLLKVGRGDASMRFMQDVAALENGLVMRSAPLSAVAGMATAVGLATLGSPASALILLCFLMLGAGGGVWIQRAFPAADDRTEGEAVAALKGRFQELLTILPDIRTADPAFRFDQTLQQLEDRLLAVRSQTVSREAATQALMFGLTGMCLSLMAFVSVKAPISGLALALLAGSMGFESLGGWVKVLSQQRLVAQARDRVAALYDLGDGEVAAGDAEKPYFVYKKQRFNLDDRLRLRLDGVSGCGKTRLVEGLVGLRQAADLEGVFDRDVFAWAPQDAPILTGTVRHNLRMAGNVSDAELWVALADAGLESRIKSLPKQLDSWIGDGGIALSGGERKRLGLARAYLRTAPVLVLDEPTEGLDAVTEARVVARLEQRLKRTGQGLILISHRPAPRVLSKTVQVLSRF